MGNSTSTQRNEALQSEYGIAGQGSSSTADDAGHNLVRHLSTPSGDEPDSDPNRSRRESRTNFSIYGTFRRHISSQSVTVQRETGRTIGTNAVVYEQEERPLVNMEDLGMRNAPITHVAAAPLARRQSTISRLGMRMLPAAMTRNMGDGREGILVADEHQSRGSAGRRGDQEELQGMGSGNHLSRHTFRTIRRASRMSTATPSHRRLRRSGSTRYADAQTIGEESNESYAWQASPIATSTGGFRNPARFRARLSRARESLSSFPIQSFFTHSSDSASQHSATQNSSGRSLPIAFADDSDHLLPQFMSSDHRSDVEEAPHELDAVEPEARNVLSQPRGQHNAMRRLPHALRNRSTRLIRRGESAPLSHLLQLAAASIAAQLSGHPRPVSPNSGSTGSETMEDPIQHFIRTLQEAADAQATENSDANITSDGNLPPVNFLRVFQFPQTEPSNPAPAASFAGTSVTMGHASVEGDSDTAPGASQDSTVTLVLVGVRSMSASSDGGDEESVLGPSLDTLLSMPFFPTTNVLRSGASGPLLRRSEARSGQPSRRNSMTSFGSFPAVYDSQAPRRPSRNSAGPTAAEGSSSSSSLSPPTSNPLPSTLPTVLSESPPGPRPPPSTPADARSGSGTPSRRPSSASAIHSPMLAHSAIPPLTMSNESAADAPPTDTTRHRRRSYSDSGGRPQLGSGASRRNGVVEPDNAPQHTGGRSWLIYVVGTNVPPDHPAFTMPTLFTDNPSYEDMQLLSTLLGPVKPPVATQEEVASAGGTCRLRDVAGSLEGQSVDDGNEINVRVSAGARCLICLCDFEAEEDVRQLAKCRHLYHRECIDEVCFLVKLPCVSVSLHTCCGR